MKLSNRVSVILFGYADVKNPKGFRNIRVVGKFWKNVKIVRVKSTNRIAV